MPLFSQSAAPDPGSVSPGLSAPSYASDLTSRVVLLGPFVQFMSPRQDLMIQSSMSLRWCHEADPAMPVLVVI
jgi:hypothetical protein